MLAPLLVAFLIALVALPVVGAITAFAFFAADLPSPEDLAKDPLAQPTKVYDREGKELLYQFAVERRELVRYEELPAVLIDATLAAEDKTFWTNPGVDLGGLARALYSELTQQPVRVGGSTITQQLVKQRIVGGEVSYKRKIREAILAVQVTRTYSKKEILELYFNQIYYGNQAYGVKAAAVTYFGKSDLKSLTLNESAILAGLPQAPSVLDLSKQENLERAQERRSYVLEQMEDTGAISPQERAQVEAEAIKLTPPLKTSLVAPHFVFQVRNQLSGILGGDESAVTRGGFKVTTTLDLGRQRTAEKYVRQWVENLHDRNVWNAALVSLLPSTGEVIAYVGSVDYENREDPRVQGQFDAAGIGLRQPGSAFKMFNYVTALKKGATLATVVVDARTDFGNKDTGTFKNCLYCPENADLQYHGPLTMRQALRESRNVPAVKFQHQYSGTEDVIQTAKELGITTEIDALKVGLSLTLGSQEVKLIDMTSAYSVLANMGVRVAPTFIRKVEDQRGRVVWEHKDFEQKRVLDPAIAWLMNDMLKETTQASRSFIFGQWTNIGRPAALKTGTTDNLRDVYSVGYTPQLIAGVWMGNSNNDPMSARDFSSAMGPGQLWRDYMREALAGVEVADWTRPANIVSANIVSSPGPFGGYGSGLLPSSLAPFQMAEWFVRGTEPRRQDDWYVQGCPAPDGTRKVAMQIKETGPSTWKKWTDLWISQAQKGQHSYGRYTWNLITADPCPSPSPSPSVSPSPTAPRPSPTAPRTTVAPTPSPTRRP